VAEVIWTGTIWQWSRGYVYAGSGLLAEQHNGVYFVHEDPVTKSKRVTSTAGAIQSTVELDPYGAEVSNFSSNTAFQPRKFTSYERDGNGSDEAMFRRYNRWHSRFDQPDPSDESYDFTDPQSLNRYSYVQNDPTNFVDPSGLIAQGPCMGGYDYETGACRGSGGGGGGGFDWPFWDSFNFGGDQPPGTPLMPNDPSRGGGGGPPKPSPLEQGLDAARNALQKKSCADLFGDLSNLGFASPTDLLNTYANNNLIRVGSSYPTANGDVKFSSADIGAITTYATGSYLNANGVKVSANVITVNKNGFFFSGRVEDGTLVNTIRGGGFEGLGLTDIRGAVLIHELLHAVGRIPSDDPSVLKDNGKQSRANAELVRKNCFGG
jgi:RHS repeat-associated protein